MRRRWYIFMAVAFAVVLPYCILTFARQSDSSSSAGPGPEYKHYENSQFLFELDYPGGWVLEELNVVPLEIRIKPRDSEYNEIQITVYIGPPLMRGVPDWLVAGSIEDNLREFVNSVEGTELTILANERVEGRWDWWVRFSFTRDGTPLRGAVLIKEKYINDEERIVYNLFYVYAGDWPEGLKVIDSFTTVD